MRLATLCDEAGSSRPVFAASNSEWVDLRELFQSFVPPYATSMNLAIEHLPEIEALAADWRWRGARVRNPLREKPIARFSPPVQPRTFRDFYAFEQHVARCRAKRGLPMEPAWYEQPAFYFSNPLGLVGHEAPVHAPQGCAELDFELELGLIIGKGGRDIPASRAWDHVAGFTIINDFSARDLQRREMSIGLGPSKSKDFATAVGPCLVTLDELQDRIDTDGKLHLDMTARVNGKELSRGNSASMYFTWPRIIEHASRDAELHPGDLLGSGTVGTGCILELSPENTGGWLKPGDVVELEIERLGILRTPIIARPETIISK